MGYKYIYNIKYTLLTILSGDEFNSYIHSGLNLLQNGLPNPQNSPFYAIYYYSLSTIEESFLHLFQLNYKITFITLPALLYLFLKRYQVSSLISLLIASFLLLSNMNTMHSRVVHLALIFVLLFLYLGSFIKNSKTYFIFLSFGALFVSYIRPEFFLSSFLFFCVVIFYSLKAYKNQRIMPPPRKILEFSKNLIFIFLTGILIYIMNGLAIGGERSFFALKQHIGRNYYIWKHGRYQVDSWAAYQFYTWI